MPLPGSIYTTLITIFIILDKKRESEYLRYLIEVSAVWELMPRARARIEDWNNESSHTRP